jgi:hypothetical protein
MRIIEEAAALGVHVTSGNSLEAKTTRLSLASAAKGKLFASTLSKLEQTVLSWGLLKLNDEMELMLPTHTVSLSLGIRRRLAPDTSCLHKSRHSSSTLEAEASAIH